MYYSKNLQEMTKQMAKLTQSVLDTWHQQIIQADGQQQQKPIEVSKQFLEQLQM